MLSHVTTFRPISEAARRRILCGCGVQGWGLRVGCMSDVDQLTVLVGGMEERCNITVITDTLIQCRPPQQQPSPALNHPLPRVTVRTHRPAYFSTISLSLSLCSLMLAASTVTLHARPHRPSVLHATPTHSTLLVV